MLLGEHPGQLSADQTHVDARPGRRVRVDGEPQLVPDRGGLAQVAAAAGVHERGHQRGLPTVGVEEHPHPDAVVDVLPPRVVRLQRPVGPGDHQRADPVTDLPQQLLGGLLEHDHRDAVAGVPLAGRPVRTHDPSTLRPGLPGRVGLRPAPRAGQRAVDDLHVLGQVRVRVDRDLRAVVAAVLVRDVLHRGGGAGVHLRLLQQRPQRLGLAGPDLRRPLLEGDPRVDPRRCRHLDRGAPPAGDVPLQGGQAADVLGELTVVDVLQGARHRGEEHGDHRHQQGQPHGDPRVRGELPPRHTCSGMPSRPAVTSAHRISSR
ncbi:hypothetical protein [Ornithinimicrobium kibberense]|uniref:hypothetical protein n=1 Tax=Ornithinimicrobium kibberense TaxID=282060 RepID=UPI0036075DC1